MDPFICIPHGEEEYYACVMRMESDEPAKMQLETGTILTSRTYARRKIIGWEKIIREGRLPEIFREFVKSHEPNVDLGRFAPL